MLTSIRANRLSAGQLVLARVWLGNSKYDYVQTRVLSAPSSKLKQGTEGFVFENINNIASKGAVKIVHEGKVRRVTFLALQTPSQLALPAPATVEAPVAKKRVHKPLTAAQKARKNELARARRRAGRATGFEVA